jgi:AraC-like DNA-binding protein
MKPKLELVPEGLDSSIHAFIFENEQFNAPWHYHDEFELTYIMESSGIRHIGSSVDNFSAGELILIHKNTPHYWKNDMSYSGGSKSVCVQWKEKSFNDFINDSKEFRTIKKLLDSSISGIKFTNKNLAKEIGEKLKNLPDLTAGKKLITFLDILMDLSLSKEIELLSIEGHRYLYSEKSDRRTTTIFNHIETNYANKITIENMSSITFMTDSSFCKYFKKQFNRSFTNYLNEFRIRKACLLLQETDNKLLDIAMTCGYENMSFFHRQFKKYLKMTPFEYRKKLI